MDIYNPDFWIKIGVTILCGGLIGLERQIKGKPSGIRTSIFICLGTSLFISMGATMNGQGIDATRILGQVVTGIGFLGAGVIISREGLVMGITSASVIWVLAGIGSLAGFRHYEEAGVITVITLFILIMVGILEKRFDILCGGAHRYNNGDAVKPTEKPLPRL